MRCPFCNTPDTRVIDSRFVEENNQVRRRRECVSCNERYTTYEYAELFMPQVIKRDHSRSPFSVDKLRNGMLKALEKRPVSADQVEKALSDISRSLRETAEREVSSVFIGELVMNTLRQLDPVAYVRFASVYRSFQDVRAFKEEINRLQKNDITEKS